MTLWYKKMKAAGWEELEKHSEGVTLFRKLDDVYITEYIDIVTGKSIKHSLLIPHARTFDKDNNSVPCDIQLSNKDMDAIEEARKYFKIDKELNDDWYKKD